MPYTCIAIDDEQLALDVLVNYISRIKAIELKQHFLDSVEAFNYLLSHPVDLIFIDINMPELSGLEFIESLDPRPEIIIVSAYREYAVEGFELKVLDYLLKPVSFDRFLKSVKRFTNTKKNLHEPQDKDTSDHITIRADRRDVRLAHDDILYIEGLKDYVRIHTKGEKYLTKSSIGNFHQLLPQDQFLRVHRSFVVNFSHIRSYSGSDLEVNGTNIPIGVTYGQQIKDRLNTL